MCVGVGRHVCNNRGEGFGVVGRSICSVSPVISVVAFNDETNTTTSPASQQQIGIVIFQSLSVDGPRPLAPANTYSFLKHATTRSSQGFPALSMSPLYFGSNALPSENQQAGAW